MEATIVKIPQNESASASPSAVAAANGPVPAAVVIQDRKDAPSPEYRATPEDYILWVVIAALLAYFAWHLQAVTAVLEKTADIERMAIYGMNVRADLMLLIGAVLALLGCMIVLRRVRTSFSAYAALEGTRARIAADSAGVIIVVLGVVLLTIVVIHPPLFERRGGPADAATVRERAATLEEQLNKTLQDQKQDPPKKSPEEKK